MLRSTLPALLCLERDGTTEARLLLPLQDDKHIVNTSSVQRRSRKMVHATLRALLGDNFGEFGFWSAFRHLHGVCFRQTVLSRYHQRTMGQFHCT